MRTFLIHAIFFASMCIGWIWAVPKKKHPVEMEPDEPWPRAPELDTEAGRRWEEEEKRKEGIKYVRYSGKKAQGKGKRNRKGPTDKADGQGTEVV